MRKDEHYQLDTWLHTEILEEKYGKISLQVLHDDGKLREVLLTDELNIARTYAVTIRSDSWLGDKLVCEINEAIRAGEAIGAAFKTRGFSISKKVLDVYPLELPDWLQDAFMVIEKFAKTRITEFFVERSGTIYSYGFVTEVYSPDFRKPVISREDIAQIDNKPSRYLQVKAVKKRVAEILTQIAPVLLFF